MSLFFHPSTDYLDSRPDTVRKLFLINETALPEDTVVRKVTDKIKDSPHYRHEVDSLKLANISSEQATLLLKAVGARVIE